MQKISAVGIFICVMVAVILPIGAASGQAGNTTGPDYYGKVAEAQGYNSVHKSGKADGGWNYNVYPAGNLSIRDMV